MIGTGAALPRGGTMTNFFLPVYYNRRGDILLHLGVDFNGDRNPDTTGLFVRTSRGLECVIRGGDVLPDGETHLGGADRFGADETDATLSDDGRVYFVSQHMVSGILATSLYTWSSAEGLYRIAGHGDPDGAGHFATTMFDVQLVADRMITFWTTF